MYHGAAADDWKWPPPPGGPGKWGEKIGYWAVTGIIVLLCIIFLSMWVILQGIGSILDAFDTARTRLRRKHKAPSRT